MPDPTPGMPAEVHSDICWSDATSVTVHGTDLAEDLIGKVDIGSFAYLLLTGTNPGPAQAAVFNAALVSLAEHGITPNVLATRMTYLGAPESLQGAVAAGLLGLGTRFVGTIEGSAQLLRRGVDRLGNAPSDAEIDATARELVSGVRAEGRLVPGLGHPTHTPVDPRAEALLRLVVEQGFDDTAVRLVRAFSRTATEQTGRALPVNVTGAIGVVVTVLELDWRIARGLGVIARTIGLVGHLREEIEHPFAAPLWHATDAAASTHLRP